MIARICAPGYIEVRIECDLRTLQQDTHRYNAKRIDSHTLPPMSHRRRFTSAYTNIYSVLHALSLVPRTCLQCTCQNDRNTHFILLHYIYCRLPSREGREESATLLVTNMDCKPITTPFSPGPEQGKICGKDVNERMTECLNGSRRGREGRGEPLLADGSAG